MSQQVFVPFLLTLFAGISTGIGSAIAFFAKRTNTSFLSLSLGFSAGVMIYVSFVELFTSSVQTLVEMHGKSEGTFYATLSFFEGIVLILLIDKLIPRYENPHEMHRVEEMSEKAKIQLDVKPKLWDLAEEQPRVVELWEADGVNQFLHEERDDAVTGQLDVDDVGGTVDAVPRCAVAALVGFALGGRDAVHEAA